MRDYCDLKTGEEPEIHIGWKESIGLFFHSGPILALCPVCHQQRQGFIYHWISRYGRAGSFWCHHEKRHISLTDRDGAPTPIFYDAEQNPINAEPKECSPTDAGKLHMVIDYSELYLLNRQAEKAILFLIGTDIETLYRAEYSKPSSYSPERAQG